MPQLKNIIECLIFVSDEPISADKIKTTLHNFDAADIKNAIQALIHDYNNPEKGLYIAEVAGGYQVRTRPEYAEWVKNAVHPSHNRLSQPAIETLAIIAYKQPIVRSEIEHLRGVDSGGIIRALLERRLIRIAGRKDVPGRPIIYGTTRFFLEMFGLKSIKDLPMPKDIPDLGEPVVSKDFQITSSKLFSDTAPHSGVTPAFYQVVK